MFFDEIKNALKLQWTLQLYKEYDDLCFQYKLRLKKPLIVICEMKNTFGNWNPQTKTISISDELPEKYSWDIVIGILKHEIAHQIVSDVYLSTDAHGPNFFKACDRIGVPREFRKATLNIKETNLDWRKEKILQEDEVVLRKLEKLLSLAQSTNEHEAFSAMEKVHELYTKYNINKIESGLKSEFYNLIINFRMKKIPALHSSIVSILHDHYFVQIVYSNLYDATLDESHKIINIMGTKHNVLMAEYVFFFLINRVDVLWKNYMKEKKITAKYKTSYIQGLIRGFHQKLDNIRTEKINKNQEYTDNKSENIHALMHIEDNKLKEFTQQNFPRLTSRSATGSLIFREHYDIGKQDGHKINLNKGVKSSSHNEKRFLMP